MTLLLWGLVWLAVAILLGLLVGNAIRLADRKQERALAQRSARHPSGRVLPYDVRRPQNKPTCPADPTRPACCASVCSDYGRPGAVGLG